jgi:hypothetical protein
MGEIRDRRSEELAAAARHRRAVELRMTMSERLAALHRLCKEMSAISAVPKRR